MLLVILMPANVCDTSSPVRYFLLYLTVVTLNFAEILKVLGPVNKSNHELFHHTDGVTQH
jgi:hypothetical protein